MSNGEYDVLFAVIAMREVVFFANVADHMHREYGLHSAFLTFYEPGDQYLKQKGYSVFSLHQGVVHHTPAVDEHTVLRIEAKYGLDNIRNLLLHEKLTFNRFDENKLLIKLVSYDEYFHCLLKRLRVRSVVQELGGFIAPLTLYYNCQVRSIRHIFIEPSMFKGRLYYNVNSLNHTTQCACDPNEELSKTVRQYIEAYQTEKTIVISVKDKHHLAFGWRKVINKTQFRHLCRKLYYKYVKRQREEYDAIFTQVRRHLVMCMRWLLTNRLYSHPDYDRPYVYFPLHVPLDFQLTVRQPRYLDQLALVERIGRALPTGVALYIKEHPSSVGGYEYRALRRLLRNEHIKLIYPTVNSYDLIQRSRCVVTINSKVGAEALMQGKGVLVLGNPDYAQAKGAVRLTDDLELNYYVRGCDTDSQDVDLAFFCRAYYGSFKGELYQNSHRNIRDVAESLGGHIARMGPRDPGHDFVQFSSRQERQYRRRRFHYDKQRRTRCPHAQV